MNTRINQNILKARPTIEDFISQIDYVLEAVRDWGGTDPRVIIPIEEEHKNTLYLLVKQNPDSTHGELIDVALQQDLNFHLPCLILVQDEKHYSGYKDKFEEKGYKLPEEINKLRPIFANIAFRIPYPVSENDGAIKQTLGFFKPHRIAEAKAKAAAKKRKEEEALTYSLAVSSETPPSKLATSSTNGQNGKLKNETLQPSNGQTHQSPSPKKNSH